MTEMWFPKYAGEKPPEGYKKVWYYASAEEPGKIYYQPDAVARGMTHAPFATYPKPQQTFWSKPQTVARFYNFLRLQNKDYKPPPWLDPDAVSYLYKELKNQNGNEDWAKWEPLSTLNPAYYTMLQMPDPEYKPQKVNLRAQQVAQDYINSLAEVEKKYNLERVEQDKEYQDYLLNNINQYRQYAEQYMGGYSTLEPWQKFQLSFTSAQAMEGRPDWTRQPAAVVQAGFAGVGGVALGATAMAATGLVAGAAAGPQVGGAVAGAAPFVGAVTGGLVAMAAYKEAMTGERTPVLSDLLRISNVLAEGTERSWGTIQQLKDFERDAQELWPFIQAAWQASYIKYESSTGILQSGDWITDFISKAANAINPEWSSGMTTSVGEVWQFQKGINSPQAIRGGVWGPDALREARERIIALPEDRTKEDVIEVWADYVDRFGYSGTLTDFLNQTFLDPMQYIPLGLSLAQKGIATKRAKSYLAAGDFGRYVDATRYAAAADFTRGSVLIDALPVGLQQLATMVTGVKGTGTIFDTLDMYRAMQMTGYTYPTGSLYNISQGDVGVGKMFFGDDGSLVWKSTTSDELYSYTADMMKDMGITFAKQSDGSLKMDYDAAKATKPPIIAGVDISTGIKATQDMVMGKGDVIDVIPNIETEPPVGETYIARSPDGTEYTVRVADDIVQDNSNEKAVAL